MPGKKPITKKRKPVMILGDMPSVDLQSGPAAVLAGLTHLRAPSSAARFNVQGA